MKSANKLGDLSNYSIYMLNHKMGLAGASNENIEQQFITQPIYDMIYPFKNGHAIVKKGDCYGVIDKNGKNTIPVIYKEIQPKWNLGYFFVSDSGGNKLCLDYNNNLVQYITSLDVIKKRIMSKENIDDEYFYVDQTINPNIVTFDKNDLVYIYNTFWDKVIYICSEAKVINSDKIVVKDRYSGKKGIIDINGKLIVPLKYDDLFYCARNENCVNDNLLEARIGDKSGYIDFDGNIKIPFVYRSCGTFKNGYAWVSDERGKVGLINRIGNIVEPLVHDNILRLNDGRIVFVDFGYSSKYYVMGKSKDYVKQDCSHKRFCFDVFHNPDFVGVETNQGKMGVTCLDGRILIPAIYDSITFWQNVYRGIIVKKNNKYGIVDINNNVLLPFDFDFLDVVEVMKNSKKEAFYLAGKNGKYGILDNNLVECIPLMYKRVDYCKAYNSFVVEVGYENAMVDFNNDILIPFTSNHIERNPSY